MDIKKTKKITKALKLKIDKENLSKIDIRDVLLVIHSMEDPRKHRIKYPLKNILIMALVSITAGHEDWVAIEEYCKLEKNWFANYLGLENLEVPSHDTFCRVFRLLKAKELEKFFNLWIKERQRGDQFAIDGKTVNSSLTPRSDGDEGVLHKVNVWSVKSGLSIGSTISKGKRNEINTVKEILEIIDVKDNTVTTDAMNTQKEVTEIITRNGGNYILALKNNHKDFYDTVVELSKNKLKKATSRTMSAEETGHGRKTVHNAKVIYLQEEHEVLQSKQSEGWVNFKSIICISSSRTNLKTQERSYEERYYISNLGTTTGIKKMANFVRSHWEVENKLHWHLDVTFNEDSQLLKAGNGLENFGLMRQFGLNLLRGDKNGKSSMRIKKMKFNVSREYRSLILGKI